MRLTIIVLIVVLTIGGSVISFGFLTNQENSVVENTTPYEKLQTYKEELEKINQYNQKILDELEQNITESDDVNLEQLREEIKVLKRVIIENQAELEEITQRLSEMDSEP